MNSHNPIQYSFTKFKFVSKLGLVSSYSSAAAFSAVEWAERFYSTNSIISLLRWSTCYYTFFMSGFESRLLCSNIEIMVFFLSVYSSYSCYYPKLLKILSIFLGSMGIGRGCMKLPS